MIGYDIGSIIISFVSCFISIIIFNMITGFTACILGDNTPKKTGVLSINPKNHIEPIGYIMYAIFGYGWSKPVEVRSGNFKDRKKGTIITYLLPILVCILLAEIIHIIPKLTGADTNMTGNTFLYYLWGFGYNFPYFLLRLAIFNIIPVYPLWGSYILKAVLNPNSAIVYAQRERIIQIILIFLILLGMASVPFDFIVDLLLGW